jgi:3-oxoadipate enol-lactonase
MLATVNGIRLAYSDTHDGQPVVLLVHGFPLNRSMWDPQLGVLRARARVIAPDLRAFGASEAGPPGPLTMQQHADDLAALLDALGIDRVIYCGLSMGGYIGFAFWRAHRERIQALILADTRATVDAPEGRHARLVMADLAETLNSPQPAVDGMLPKMFSPTLRAGSVQEQLLRGMMLGSTPRAVADGQRGLAARPDSVPVLESIDVPTLVIVGEHDALTPPHESELMVSKLPHARLVTIDQAGHMANLENPSAFNAALEEFLDAQARSQ